MVDFLLDALVKGYDVFLSMLVALFIAGILIKINLNDNGEYESSTSRSYLQRSLLCLVVLLEGLKA